MRRNEILIRSYVDADFASTSLLWFDGWKMMGLTRPERDPLTAFRRRFRDKLARGCSMYVATIASRIIGFVALEENQVTELFVAPKILGNGIGKSLLDFAKSLRPNGLWLTTPVENDGGRRFYEREGLVRGKARRSRRIGIQVIRYDWRPQALGSV